MSRDQDAFDGELKRLWPEADPMHLRYHNRSSSRFAGSVQLFENGIVWYQGPVDSPQAAARAVFCWTRQRMNAPELEKEFPSWRLPEGRRRIEESAESFLEWHWDYQRDNYSTLAYPIPELRSVSEAIQFFARQRVARRLMSFHQLVTYGFSRRIGYFGDRFENDLFRVAPGEGKNELWLVTERQAKHNFSGGHSYLLRGNVETVCTAALDRLATLPAAEYQTLEQYLERTGQR